MKIDLDIQTLEIINVALKNMTIKGEDAVVIAQVITKLQTAFEKEIAKQSG